MLHATYWMCMRSTRKNSENMYKEPETEWGRENEREIAEQSGKKKRVSCTEETNCKR